MFACLRAKRGGPYPFRITLFCFWKSQFQSTFPSLFFSAVWPDVTFGLAAVAFIKPLQKYGWWSSKTISWATQTGCPAAPHMNRIKGLRIGRLPMRQWCFFSVMCLRDASHHRQSLNYPEPADQNALGGFRQCFFVATVSAFSVCPYRLPLTPALNVCPYFGTCRQAFSSICHF